MKAIHMISEKLLELLTNFIAHLPLIILSIIVLILTFVLAKLTSFLIKRSMLKVNLRPSLIEVFQKLSSTVIWIAGILISATILFPTLTPGKILTALGLSSIAVGLAFKDIFENFMAGILILLRESFHIGDFIECKNFDGQVEQITIRDTHIRQTDGQRVVIPNAILFKNPVKVITDLEMRRTTVFCQITNKDHLERAKELIYKAVKSSDSVSMNHEIQVYAHEFGDGSIQLEITWWTKSKPSDIRYSHDQIISAIKKSLDESDIEIASSQRILVFKTPLTIENKTDKREA